MKKKDLILLCLILIGLTSSSVHSQDLNLILGRPTDHSVTLNILSDRTADIYIQFGVDPEILERQTEVSIVHAGTPLVIEIEGLAVDSRYFYRTIIRPAGSESFQSGTTGTFHTQRSKGSIYVFTVESDPHPYDKKGCHNLWNIALDNQLKDTADFMIDMGDTFGDDHQPFTITSQQVKQLQLDCRDHFGTVSHSLPFYFGLGNHEGESGYYLLQTPPENLAVYETLWRKLLYPNPLPDGFYTGNTESEPYGIGQPANYYAWEWGDALFVVLDAYRYYTVSAKPRGWDWTLGKTQYDWLKRTLESSNAKFKLVFAHHIAGESRGAVKIANLYEWGGYNTNGTWEFDQYRQGWELPVHQLMVKNHVSIFFQGHDHLFAKEELDGIVYQEIPMPDDSTYAIGMLANADAYLSNQTGGSGHLRVTVSPDSVGVEFVHALLPADETASRHNREVAFQYSVKGGSAGISNPVYTLSPVADIKTFPNPVQEETTIQYRLKSEMDVSITILDSRGREVDTLTRGPQMPGIHTIPFRPKEHGLQAGIIFARIQAGDWQKYVKLIYNQ